MPADRRLGHVAPSLLLMASLGMGRETNRRVHRTITVVAALALHDLQEKPLRELLRINLEKLAARVVAVIQDAAFTHVCDLGRLEIVARLEIVVIVARNMQERHTPLAQFRDGRENVAGRKCNVIQPGTAIGL
jgi:hypothetical protein